MLKNKFVNRNESKASRFLLKGETMQYQNINITLYLAARKHLVPPADMDDTERIKEARDAWVQENFHKANYKLLNDAQKRLAISLINQNKTLAQYNEENGNNRRNPADYATLSQRAMLKYYSIGVAVAYADLTGITTADGTELPTKLAREILIEKFETKKIDKIILQKLYERFINPLVNRYLAEAGLRMPRTNISKFNYNTLSKSEIQVLINRFRAYSETNNQRDYSQIPNFDFSLYKTLN